MNINKTEILVWELKLLSNIDNYNIERMTDGIVCHTSACQYYLLLDWNEFKR